MPLLTYMGAELSNFPNKQSPLTYNPLAVIDVEKLVVPKIY